MLVLLCSGQGTQHREMFHLTANLQAASAIFATAERLLGMDPRDFVRSASDEALHSNRAAQILCATQALAARSLLVDAPPLRRCMIAGYSVGEVASWGIIGLLDPEHTIDLARARAEIMDSVSAPDDGLAFVRGLSPARVAELAHDRRVEIAIVTPKDSFIVGGGRPALQEFCDAAVAAGALRAALLPVAVASHTSRLAAAAEVLRATLATYRPARPRGDVTLLSGLDGSPLFDADAAIDSLSRQISTTVRWDVCLNAAIERGGSLFLELGPGRALAEMARATFPDVPARSIDDFRSRDGVLSWLSRH